MHRVEPLIGQHQMRRAFAHRGLRLPPEALQGVAQPPLLAGGGEGAVEPDGRPLGILEHLGIVRIRQHGAFEEQDLDLAGVLGEHVGQVVHARAQCHHPPLAQAVDRRVRHLAELLAEKMMQAPVVPGEHGDRRVVAHAAHRLLAFLRHRAQEQLQILEGETESALEAAQLGRVEILAFVGHLLDRVERPDALHPGAIGVLGGELVLDRPILEEAPLLQVDGDHLAGTDPSLFQHPVFGDRHHARLGADDQQAVRGDRVAQRAQAVAVHAGDRPAAVGGAERGRAVPRSHQRVGVGIEIAVRLRHHLRAPPDLGHQERLHHRRGAAGAHQHLEHGIERRRIGRARLHDRLDRIREIPEGVGGHLDLVALHPVDVAAQRVDLAVVSEHAERLGETPGGEGVRRIALVIDRERRDEALVAQVGEEIVELLGEKHPLVDQTPAGERADVEIGDVRVEHRFFDPAADQEQLAFERGVVRIAPVFDQHLLDLRPGGIRLLADHRGIHRHLAPAVDAVAEVEDRRLDEGAAGFLRRQVGLRQEHGAEAELALSRLEAGAPHVIAEEVLRNLHVDAGAVAGLAVGVHRPAVPEGLERLQAGFDHAAVRLGVERGDQADTTGVVLVLRAVHPLRGEPLGLGLPTVRAHAATSAARA